MLREGRSWKPWQQCFALALIAGWSLRAEAASRYRAGPNNRFYDNTGRVAIFRGVNVAGRVKTPPFAPFADLTSLDSLASLGTNVARVPFIWEGYESTRGQYNVSYLNYYKSVIGRLYRMGIVSIVDVHQDAISRYLNGGCGDGFPKWVIPARYTSSLRTPNNAEDCRSWKLTILLDPVVRGTWDAFYANENGVRDAFLSMWGSLAAAFAGDPGVLGYDILNEPFGSERLQIGPLWEDAARVIRSKDKDAILFLNPLFLLGAGGDPGMTQPTFTNYAVAVHWYPMELPLTRTTAGQFAVWFRLVKPWGAPLFVGEFGFEPHCVDNGQLTVPDKLNDMYNYFDQNFISGTQWNWHNAWDNTVYDGWNMEDYSIMDNLGNLRINFVIRPYPRAIAGIPLSFQVDLKMKTMSLRWNVTTASLTQNPNTIVFAPLRAFFGVLTTDWITIQAKDPAGGNFPCTYVDGMQATIIRCVPSRTGVHSLQLAPRAGIPTYLLTQASF